MYCSTCKYTGHQHTHHTTKTMTGEYIKGIIHLGSLFYRDCYIGNHGSNQTNNNTLRNTYKSRGGGDGNKSDNCTNTEGEYRWLLSFDNIKKHPGKTC